MEYTTAETVGKSCFYNAGGGLTNAFQLRLPLATSGARDPIYVLSKCQVAIEQLEIKQQISVN